MVYSACGEGANNNYVGGATPIIIVILIHTPTHLSMLV